MWKKPPKGKLSDLLSYVEEEGGKKWDLQSTVQKSLVLLLRQCSGCLTISICKDPLQTLFSKQLLVLSIHKGKLHGQMKRVFNYFHPLSELPPPPTAINFILTPKYVRSDSPAMYPVVVVV